MIPAYTLELQVSWLFVFLVLLELTWPGVTLTKMKRLLVRSIKWLRYPLFFTGAGNISTKKSWFIGVIALDIGRCVVSAGS